VNISNIVRVGAGGFHFLAIDSSGSIFGCGDNYVCNHFSFFLFFKIYLFNYFLLIKYGGIGVGTWGNQYSNLFQIPIVGSAVSASAGYGNSFVRTSNNQVYAFGYNYVSSKLCALIDLYSFSQ